MTGPVAARRDDIADVMAAWYRTPRWQFWRRWRLWEQVQNLTDDLVRIESRQAGAS